MVKHRRRRRQKLIFAQVIAPFTVGTPADGAVIKQDFPNSVNDTRLAISLKTVVSIRGLAVGEGPIEIGVAHSDYSAAEIEEALESAGNWDLGDKVAQEQANRRVRRIGEFQVITADEVLNDGKPIYTKLNWKLNEGDTLSTWIRNAAGLILTTGGLAALKGKLIMKAIQ